MFGKKEPRGALPAPASADSDPKSGELLRAWAAHGGLHVSLNPRGLGDDPSVWGILLVDVARHVARAFQNELKLDPGETMARIGKMFDAEWDRPTDMGATAPQRKQ